MPNANARRVPYSKLRWNQGAQRYSNDAGRFLSATSVRDVMEEDLQKSARDMLGYGNALKLKAQALKDGAITQVEYVESVRLWRDQTLTAVKSLHLGNVAMAAGGFHNMDAASHGRAGGLIGAQARWLSNFAVEAAANPDIVLSLDKSRRPFDDRVSAYALAGRGSYNRERHAQHIEAGYRSKYNEEEPGAHHCTGPRSCPAMTALGTVAIDDPRYITAGYRACTVYCQCEEKYLKAEASSI